MPDFTSALYLGLRHPSRALRPWDRLTAGVPAALAEPPGATAVAAALARLVGVERATLARSTLHAFWDLFPADAPAPSCVLLDACIYPIARWAAERPRARGIPVAAFRHHDPGALRRALRAARAQPWVLTDGFCTGCDGAAPLAEYLAAVREVGGRLIVDDTQALGILGTPAGASPYGRSGGGSLRAAELDAPEVLYVASLAKGLGAPLAVVGGSAAAVEAYEARGELRLHASPPPVSDLHAAQHALIVNRARGDALRRRLADRVGRLEAGLRRLGLPPGRSWFPLRPVRTGSGLDPARLWDRLAAAGVRALLRRSPCEARLEVALVITAAHSPEDVDLALEALEQGLAGAAGHRAATVGGW